MAHGCCWIRPWPAPLKGGPKPGTPEFRKALRDALESTRNLAVPNGVFNISRTTTRASTSVPA